MDSLKLFVLRDSEYTGYTLRNSMVISDTEDNALPDLLIHDPHHVFFKPITIKCLIHTFFLKYKSEMFEAKKLEEISDEMIENCLEIWYRTSPLKNKIKIAKYTLNYWGIECEEMNFEEIFISNSGMCFMITACNQKTNIPFYEQFLKLPREKQIQLGKLFIRESEFHIESYPIISIPGIEKVTQNAEDKMNEMRLDVLKVMRRNVPGELIDMCIGKYL